MTHATQIARNGGDPRWADQPIHEVEVTLDATTTTVTATHITVTVTPDTARRLALELDIAAEPPTTCRCGRLVEKPSSLTDLCQTCQTREDQK